MKRSWSVLAVIVVVACAALSVLPTNATVAPAGDLQLVASGADGVVVNAAGCTKITNRFCAQSTRDNCNACR